MGEDFFLLTLPNFIPFYDKDTCYGYSKYRDNLLCLLMNTSKEYCMYCYNRILINGESHGQIEHGIEKSNSERLIDCVPNLGIACSKCNQSYKKKGESKRKIDTEFSSAYEEGDCLSFNCKGQCYKYKILRNKYIEKANIILQPFGVVNDRTGNEYRIQYDLLKGKYMPSKEHGKYTSAELAFINNHIQQFGLNSPERRNFEIGKYCKNVIAQHSILKGFDYNNLLVDLFRDKLSKLELEEAVHICEFVYENNLIQLQT